MKPGMLKNLNDRIRNLLLLLQNLCELVWGLLEADDDGGFDFGLDMADWGRVRGCEFEGKGRSVVKGGRDIIGGREFEVRGRPVIGGGGGRDIVVGGRVSRVPPKELTPGKNWPKFWLGLRSWWALCTRSGKNPRINNISRLIQTMILFLNSQAKIWQAECLLSQILRWLSVTEYSPLFQNQGQSFSSCQNWEINCSRTLLKSFSGTFLSKHCTFWNSM